MPPVPATTAPVRPPAKLFADSEGQTKIGHVSSGGFGPSAVGPIAMGYVPTAMAEPGTQAQRAGQPRQAQACGQAAQHGAPRPLGRCGSRRCTRRCGGLGSGCVVCGVLGRCRAARRFALGHVARLLSNGLTAPHALGFGVHMDHRHQRHQNYRPQFHRVISVMSFIHIDRKPEDCDQHLIPTCNATTPPVML